MKRQFVTDIFAFANTAAGKALSVLVAMVMVLSLSGIALAVDGAVQAAAGAASEGEAASTTAEGNAAEEGEETIEIAGAAAESGEESIEIISTEDAIQEAATQDAPAAEEGTNKVDEATVALTTENCTIEIGGAQLGTGSVVVPLHTAFTLDVVPHSGYSVKEVFITSNGPIPFNLDESLLPFTVPAELVDSSLAIHATAEIVDPNAEVDDPLPTPIEEEDEIIPDGYYDAPVITVPDLTFTYNGSPQPTDLMYVEAQVEGLQEGDELVLTGFTGTQPTNVSESGAIITVTDYTIFRSGVPITEKYQPATFAKADSVITIEKADLYIVTPSATKTYDGTPLEYEGSIEEGDETRMETLWNYSGPAFELHATGSQTEIGTSVNGYSLTPASVLNALRENYNIYLDLGTLTVLPPDDAAYLIVPSASKTYDGTPLSVSAANLDWVGLPDGFTVEAQLTGASRTAAGKSTVSVDRSSIVIRNAEGENVTSAYSVEVLEGELDIEPAYLYVLTFSDSKTNDGTPLTAGGELAGLVAGETASFTVTGSQSGVGSSINTYTIAWNGTASESNYRVVEDLGTLTVHAAETGGNTGTGGNAGGSGGNGGNGGNGGTTGGTGAGAGSAGLSYGTGAGVAATAAGTGTNANATAQEEEAEEGEDGLNPVVEAIATGMQNLEQTIRGEDTTPLAAPAVEESLGDDETPLGVFDAPIDCWVHWYSVLGIIVTVVYGAVVMFFRRAYAYELESREADVLGAPVGIAQPHVPVSTSSDKAGRQA